MGEWDAEGEYTAHVKNITRGSEVSVSNSNGGYNALVSA